MEIRRADEEGDIETARAIRLAVFVDEQGVPKERELDGFDDEATHLLAEDGETPIGTARFRPYRGEGDTGTVAKIERVAVSADRRGEGIGRELMNAVEAAAVEEGYETALLYAQVPVVPFYRQLGYETKGKAFEDAGIAHREMRKRL